MFKRFFAFLLLVFSVFLLWKSSYTVTLGEGGESYLYRNSSSAEITTDRVKTFFALCTGEGKVYDHDDYKRILNELNATTVFAEDINGGINIYAYSEKIAFLKVINGKKINVQLYVKDGKIKAGFPLIYGSY